MSLFSSVPLLPTPLAQEEAGNKLHGLFGAENRVYRRATNSALTF
jgi:hypothetical protein